MIDYKELSKNLLEWWGEKQRKFPWRNTRDPYRIMVSEIMLHRTRANQVVPIYLEFLKRFPTISSLSKADMNDLKNVLYPLGLRWRTRLLLEMVIEIMDKYEGKIPSSREELESLPGVGQYIASAVRCFSFGYPSVLLDTNTVRILGRVFGIEVTDSSRRSQRFREFYLSLIDAQRPREFNYAMIDLGGLICKPKEPFCNSCPISEMCKYGNRQKHAPKTLKIH